MAVAMSRFEVTKIRELEEAIDLLYDERRRLCKQINGKSVDDPERVRIEYKLKDSEKEIAAREEELASLKGRWSDYLHLIDFDRAEQVADPVIKRLGEEYSAALFFIQDGKSFKGDYCVKRLKNRLHSVSSNVVPINIGHESGIGSIKKTTILQYLAGYEYTQDSDMTDDDTAIKRLCSPRDNRIIFIDLRFNENLKHRLDILTWLLTEFWHKLVDHLNKIRAQSGYRLRVVLTILSFHALETNLLDRSLFHEGKDFDQRRIVELPLEMWGREVVKKWLINYSKLALTDGDVSALVEKVYAACPSGLPIEIDAELQDSLVQLTLDQQGDG